MFSRWKGRTNYADQMYRTLICFPNEVAKYLHRPISSEVNTTSVERNYFLLPHVTWAEIRVFTINYSKCRSIFRILCNSVFLGAIRLEGFRKIHLQGNGMIYSKTRFNCVPINKQIESILTFWFHYSLKLY